MRIAIVNDTLVVVEALRRTLTGSAGHQLAWVAYSGEDAVRLCEQDLPDLLLMDLLLPDIDGVETTRRIMAATPCAILLFTASPSSYVGKVFDAMGVGALDVVASPVATTVSASAPSIALLTKIEALGTRLAPSGR